MVRVPWEHRLRYQSLEHFRISRSYFFGVGLLQVRAVKDPHPQKYRCCLKNRKVHCIRLCDPWGHHVFLCEVTSKHAEHNVLRDTLRSFGSSYGFISDSEIPVPQWQKRPDVQWVDPAGQVWSFFLDVTIPAHYQEAHASNEDILSAARREKSVYVTRDDAGQRVIEAQPVPFVITSMGLFCSEAHDFLKFCYSRNPRATSALQDCLAVQHAKWIAHRLYRGLGPHRDSSAGFLPPQAPAPFSRNPGKGKKRGALRRFDRTYDSQTSTVGSAVSTGSQFDHTPASQFSPVSPPYSQFGSTPASQSSPVSPQSPQEEQGA